MRELLLLRHGKSDWPPGVPDFDRPLARRGKRNAVRIGAYLCENNRVPDRIVTSPAMRAADTARRVAKAIHLDPSAVAEEPRLYHAEVRTILEIVRRLPDTVTRVILVGHNPGMENLVGEMTGRPEPLPTAALAIVEHHGPWREFAPDRATIAALIHPRELD